MVVGEGCSVRGLQQGRTIGFPTINIAYEGELRAPAGVHAARVTLADGVLNGAAVVGGDFVESVAPKLEVYLLGDTKRERYGELARVELLQQVSELQKIVDVDVLRQKIIADVAAVEKYFS